MSFDPNQLRGQPKNKGSWAANDNGDPEATLGTSDGAEANAVSPSERLASGPYKPGTIGGYEVKNYKNVAGMGPEGGAFTASIYRAGKRVLTVSNSGWGGGNDYRQVTTVPGDGVKERRALDATAREVEGVTASTAYFEPDMFVDLVQMAGEYQKHAKKHGFSYTDVATASLTNDGDMEDYAVEAILHPEQFSNDL